MHDPNSSSIYTFIPGDLPGEPHEPWSIRAKKAAEATLTAQHGRPTRRKARRADPTAPRTSQVDLSGDLPGFDDGPIPNRHGLTERLRYQTYTDTGNAQRLVARYGDRMKFVLPSGWHVWDGRRWAPDQKELQVLQMAQRAAYAIRYEAGLSGEDDADEVGRASNRAMGEARLVAMVKLARVNVRDAVENLDADPMLFNVENGTIDLQTGTLREHRREDCISQLAGVRFDPAARCPTWLAFLDSTFGGDQDVIAFIQRAVGYSLTASTVEPAMMIPWGNGSNGKSTFLETLQKLMGSYAGTAPSSTLLEKKGSGIPNDIARMRGLRFISASETNDGAALDEALIKRLTGGDTTPARFLHGEFFDFKPGFKIWLATNHRPAINGTDHGIWRRLMLIPFEVRFVDETPENRAAGRPIKDKGLPARLLQELPGILNWAIEGCLEWRRTGLLPPERVSAPTEQYRADMDSFQVFLDTCTVAGASHSLPASELYDAYRGWCRQSVEADISVSEFGSKVRNHGIRKVKRSTMHYLGLALSPTGRALISR